MWMMWCVKVDHNTGVYVPYSFRTVVWVLLRPTWTDQWKCCQTGRTVFRPSPRSLTICRSDVITKAALSSQLFKDPECWSGRGSNPWPPVHQTLLSHLSHATKRQFCSLLIAFYQVPLLNKRGQQEGNLHAHACIRWTTIAWVHQIWWRKIENNGARWRTCMGCTTFG